MGYSIDFKGNKKQVEVVGYWNDEETSSICYSGGVAVGKSYLLCSLIFQDALHYPGTLYFIADKELSYLRKHTSQTIDEILRQWGVTAKFHSADNYWELPNGSRVFYLSYEYKESDPMYRRLGSVQFTRGAIERGEMIEEAAYHALVATTGRWKNVEYGLKAKVLTVTRPNRECFLYHRFYLPYKEGTLSSWKKMVVASPYDNPMVSEEYLRMIERELPQQEYSRLVMGEWD